MMVAIHHKLYDCLLSAILLCVISPWYLLVNILDFNLKAFLITQKKINWRIKDYRFQTDSTCRWCTQHCCISELLEKERFIIYLQEVSHFDQVLYLTATIELLYQTIRTADCTLEIKYLFNWRASEEHLSLGSSHLNQALRKICILVRSQ